MLEVVSPQAFFLIRNSCFLTDNHLCSLEERNNLWQRSFNSAFSWAKIKHFVKDRVALPGISGQCRGFAKSWSAQDANPAVSRHAGDSGACSATEHRSSQALFSPENLWLWMEHERVPRTKWHDHSTIYPRAPSKALLVLQALGMYLAPIYYAEASPVLSGAKCLLFHFLNSSGFL